MNRALINQQLAELSELLGDVPRAYSAAQNSLAGSADPDAFAALARKLRVAADAASAIAVEVRR